ncbi:hypothetical protein ATCVCanal1_185R [Acanthocystis turfacea Chlorella virus Canal-1]|nr:hypothetical protein ATCVCanal1_185R [Acanthocystis turfacea Chlorella virus Canal-1]
MSHKIAPRFCDGRSSGREDFHEPLPVALHTHPRHTDPEYDARVHKNAHDNLWVVTAISNPVRYKTRYALYRKFKHHITQELKLNLITVECSFGKRDHQLTSDLVDENCTYNILKNGVRTVDVRVKNGSQVWLKENLWNIGARFIPFDCEYVLFADADIHFTHPHFATELVNSLQEYRVVQPFETACDLGPDGQVIGVHRSFGYCHANGWEWRPKPNSLGGYYVEKTKERQGPSGFGIPFHPGFAMAFRREVLDKMQLLEVGVLGAGDHHMCAALINKVKLSLPGKIHSNYKKECIRWEKRAEEVVNGSFGYVVGTILHDFHGAKKNRKYVSRWEILLENEYDPEKDVYKNCYGVLELEMDKKPKLRDAIMTYFRTRHEDSIEIE